MRRLIASATVLALTFASTCAQYSQGSVVEHGSGSHFLVWQGFNYAWENEAAGFYTPHRMGTFGTYFSDVSEDSSGTLHANAQFAFTPGVNGDKSHPETLYAVVEASDESSVSASWGSYDFSFTDHSKYEDKNPEGVTSISDVVRLPLPLPHQSEQLNQDVEVGVAIGGFRIDMHCDPSKQPAKGKCNSNGVWPYRLYLSLDNCETNNGATVDCELAFDLFRAWTPSQGGLKAFNYVMDYSVHFNYTVVTGKSDHFSAAPAPEVSSTGTIHDKATVLSSTESTPSDTATVPGLSAFGFQLSKTNGYSKLGRYIEALRFFVKADEHSRHNRDLKFDQTIGFEAPATVYNSDISYWMKPLLLNFKEDLHKTASGSSVKGQVCLSDWQVLNWCKREGMKEQKEDTVAFSHAKTNVGQANA